MFRPVRGAGGRWQEEAGSVAREARTHYAILGLLCWKSMSGYDIRKMVEVGLSHFWSESYGQIFPTLNRLVEQGLATRSVDPGSGNRRRQVYRVTAAGRRVFKEWMKRPSALPRLRDEVKLKFFLTSRGETAESIRLLEAYGRQQREHLAMLKDSQTILEAAWRDGNLSNELDELKKTLAWTDKGSPAQTRELLMFLLTLRSGIMVTEARVAWVDEAISVLKGTQHD
ncbi:MAG TPA: PadR family transcriptional regulator [Candidatus Krumholzibacteria bacterium]|nr:PadR family transcriptional regulator [Candidatus Krumholzibacteria bacterium]